MIFPDAATRLLSPHQVSRLAGDPILKTACPSIAYRIRREMLNESPQSGIMQYLQGQILGDARVREVLRLQREDGWLGGQFHGSDEPESCIRFLCEKGVDPRHTVIQRALRALGERGDAFDDGCLSHVGKALDACHLGGSLMIKACVFAYAGRENEDVVKEQTAEALSGFKYVLSVRSVDDIARIYKDEKYVFIDGAQWPGIYHLKLLAHTNSWRSEENLKMLSKSLINLAQLSPIPNINLLYKGQLISPASAFMHDFDADMPGMNAKQWMMWLVRTELISRLGVVSRIPFLEAQVRNLYDLLDSNGGMFPKAPSHYYFTKWTPYLGLALENDWKQKACRINDITFRCLLILSNSGLY